MRRHAADGGQEELVKKRSSHIGTKVGIWKELDGKRYTFGIRRKDGCGVVEMSQPLVTVKGSGDVFVRKSLRSVSSVGPLIFSTKESGWMGFCDVVFGEKVQGVEDERRERKKDV